MKAIRESVFWCVVVLMRLIDWLIAVPLLFVGLLLALPGMWLQEALERYRDSFRDDVYDAARLMLNDDEHRGRRSFLAATCLGLLSLRGLVGCGATVQPVRFQPVPVVTVKPCLAGKPLPREANIRTDPVCEKSRVECLTDAVADIEDLKREAIASRKLLKECSK